MTRPISADEPPILFGEYIAPFIVASEYLAVWHLYNLITFELVHGWFNFNPFGDGR